MLILIFEYFVNGFGSAVLDFASFISIIFGINIIVIKNPIMSVLALICLFGSMSAYLASLGLLFIAIAYLLVYIGAISILFLFILMLINVRLSELQGETNNSLGLAFLSTIAFTFPVQAILPSIKDNYGASLIGGKFVTEIHNIYDVNWDLSSLMVYILSTLNYAVYGFYYVTSYNWDGNLFESGHISSIGLQIYASHLMWLIITSIILLLAMVGSIVITMRPAKADIYVSSIRESSILGPFLLVVTRQDISKHFSYDNIEALLSCLGIDTMTNLVGTEAIIGHVAAGLSGIVIPKLAFNLNTEQLAALLNTYLGYVYLNPNALFSFMFSNIVDIPHFIFDLVGNSRFNVLHTDLHQAMVEFDHRFIITNGYLNQLADAGFRYRDGYLGIFEYNDIRNNVIPLYDSSVTAFNQQVNVVESIYSEINLLHPNFLAEPEQLLTYTEAILGGTQCLKDLEDLLLESNFETRYYW